MSARAALVTGGSSGIGLAIARMLGQEGYGITLSARRPDKLEAAAEQLRGEGFDVESVPASMGEEAELASLIERHEGRFGRLDVLEDQMIQPSDIAGAVRYLLSTSPACFVPEVQFVRAGDVY